MKLLKIKVIPKSKENSVKKIGEIFHIKTTAPAIDDKANLAIIPLLARFLDTKNYNLKIIKGKKSREKIIAFDE